MKTIEKHPYAHEALRPWNLVRLKRSECAVLPLVLKGRWFDMIASGEKREEYRDTTYYWRIRLHNWDRSFVPGTCPVVEFRRGYARDAARMAFWPFGVPTESGPRIYAYTDKARHPEWGEPETDHFVIRLGGRVMFVSEGEEVAK